MIEHPETVRRTPHVKSLSPWGGDLTRSERVNTIRGVACILLVFSHSVNDFESFTGIYLPFLQYINEALKPVRMPLFSFLSGFVYAYRPIESGEVTTFLTKKVRRLLIPFVVLTALILSMKSVFPSASQPDSIANMPYYMIFGYSHLWFLQSLFIIFLAISAFDPWVKNKALGYGIAVGLAALAYALPVADIKVLSLDGAIYLFPFFLFGAWASVVSDRLSQNKITLSIILFFITSILFLFFVIQLLDGITSRLSIISFSTSIASILLLFLMFPKIKILASMGRYSYAIYLFHSIFTALAVRLLGPSPAPAMIVVVVGIALIGPIICEIVITRRLTLFSFVIGKPVPRIGWKRRKPAAPQ